MPHNHAAKAIQTIKAMQNIIDEQREQYTALRMRKEEQARELVRVENRWNWGELLLGIALTLIVELVIYAIAFHR